MDWATCRDSQALRTLAKGLQKTTDQLLKRADAIDAYPPQMRGGRSFHYQNIKDAREVIALFETGLFKTYPIGHVTGYDSVRAQAVEFWIDRLLKRRARVAQDAKVKACLAMLHSKHTQSTISARLGMSQAWVSKCARAQRLRASRPCEPRQAQALQA